MRSTWAREARGLYSEFQLDVNEVCARSEPRRSRLVNAEQTLNGIQLEWSRPTSGQRARDPQTAHKDEQTALEGTRSLEWPMIALGARLSRAPLALRPAARLPATRDVALTVDRSATATAIAIVTATATVTSARRRSHSGNRARDQRRDRAAVKRESGDLSMCDYRTHALAYRGGA